MRVLALVIPVAAIFTPSMAFSDKVKTPPAVSSMISAITKVGSVLGGGFDPASVDCVKIQSKSAACVVSYGRGAGLLLGTREGVVVVRQWVATKSESTSQDQAKSVTAFFISNNVHPDEWERMTRIGADCLNAAKGDAKPHAVRTTRGSAVLTFEPTGTGCVAMNGD